MALSWRINARRALFLIAQVCCLGCPDALSAMGHELRRRQRPREPQRREDGEIHRHFRPSFVARDLREAPCDSGYFRTSAPRIKKNRNRDAMDTCAVDN